MNEYTLTKNPPKNKQTKKQREKGNQIGYLII